MREKLCKDSEGQNEQLKEVSMVKFVAGFMSADECENIKKIKIYTLTQCW